ncbi:MAG TPA: hypothetical protein VKX17_22525 [Planctomycetota bacterium]|nr:hypothetical protein [Planctomycetota bacterium]
MSGENYISSTAPRPSLDDVKRTAAPLLDVLGHERPGNHGPCRFCGNRDALSVHQGAAGWRFHCHSCGAAGSVIDALALAESISIAEAITRLAGPCTAPRRAAPKPAAPPAPVEPLPPVPNQDTLRRVHERAMRTLYESPELQGRWLAKRGITIDTARAFGLGFMPFVKFTGWKHAAKDAWIIPITSAAGDVLALKLHKENATHGPKALWAPLGTEPKDRPRHGFATLWPPPESFWPADEFDERAAILEIDGGLARVEAERRARLEVGRATPWLYIAPGELKALAVVSAGLHCTSVTAGESFRWTPGTLARLAGRRACIIYDDDPAGHRFKNNTLAALRNTAAELKAVTFGRKENP